jgi:hypothetical protein
MATYFDLIKKDPLDLLDEELKYILSIEESERENLKINKWSELKWLDIFPEAKNSLIKNINVDIKTIKLKSKYILSEIKKCDDSYWIRILKIYLSDYKFLYNFNKNMKKKVRDKFEFKDVKLTGKITNQDIKRAKEYPVENLIEFNIGGFAHCIKHEEKTPSMFFYKKNNVAHCFGCNETFDSIEIVKIQKGCGFIEAVKFLIQ